MKEKTSVELALEARAAGYNCCQSVLLGCGKLCSLPEEAAVFGACFGSGMQCGSVCGALTGGLMALGAALPQYPVGENRPLARAAAMELEKGFAQKFGSMLCSDIIRGSGRRICEQCVAYSAEETANIIQKIKTGEFNL